VEGIERVHLDVRLVVREYGVAVQAEVGLGGRGVRLALHQRVQVTSGGRGPEGP
jgi:hypothetical protein